MIRLLFIEDKNVNPDYLEELLGEHKFPFYEVPPHIVNALLIEKDIKALEEIECLVEMK